MFLANLFSFWFPKLNDITGSATELDFDKRKVNFARFSAGNVFLISPYLALHAGSNNKCYRPFTNILSLVWFCNTERSRERECEIWGTVQSWASNFYLHTHVHSIHVNITFVGTSVIYFLLFDARSIAVLSSTCFSTLSFWLFLNTYWRFFLYFYQAKYVLIFTEM